MRDDTDVIERRTVLRNAGDQRVDLLRADSAAWTCRRSRYRDLVTSPNLRVERSGADVITSTALRPPMALPASSTVRSS
ncbi:hypothetical protein [Streptomyces sp. KR80]|uniref:hypothetical protein n=1 Tax=Streptomyces sp. KR80 TaxID=3457426 RepID=UPI003FCF8901